MQARIKFDILEVEGGPQGSTSAVCHDFYLPREPFLRYTGRACFGVHVLVPGVEPLEMECVRVHLITENTVTDYCRFSIVAIHGLDGHCKALWTTKQGTLWLRDFFPKKLPHALVLTYGYDAYTWTGNSLQPNPSTISRRVYCHL